MDAGVVILMIGGALTAWVAGGGEEASQLTDNATRRSKSDLVRDMAFESDAPS
jgi:hypothetical protein